MCQTFGDVLQSKQPHPRVSIHSPLLRLAVRLAAVVHESGLVPFGPSVNDPVLRRRTHKSPSLLKEACVCRGVAHLVQCEHVEVTDVVFLSVPDPGSTLFLIYNLPHVFTHKCSLWLKQRMLTHLTKKKKTQIPLKIVSFFVFTFLMSDTARKPHPQDSVL